MRPGRLNQGSGSGPQRPDAGGALRADAPLVEFLVRSRAGERFLAATMTANADTPLIIATGEPVVALGGFSGGDRILTPAQLQARVAAGEVRFFLVPADDQQGRQQVALIRWVETSCAPVPPARWQAGQPALAPGGSLNRQLWDCAS